MQTNDEKGPSDADIEEAIAQAQANVAGRSRNRRERRLYKSGGRKSAYDQSIWSRMKQRPPKTKSRKAA